MKKIVKLLLLSLAMVTVLLFSTTSAKAEGTTFTTNPAEMETAKGLTQVSASSKTATISWKPVLGATAYYVYVKSGSSDRYTGVTTKVTSANVTLPAGTRCRAFVLSNVKGFPSTYGDGAEIATIPPSPVLTISYIYWYSNQIDFKWGACPAANGFQFQASNSSGKVVRTGTVTYSSSVSNYYTMKNFEGTFYTARVRGYVNINGKTFYGPWSNVKHIGGVSPSKMSCVYYRGSKRIVMKWKRISGATKYTVYISKKDEKHYIKAATLSSKRSSCTIRKYGRASFKRGTKYHVKLVVSGKYNHKTVSSNLYMAYYQTF